MCQCIWKAIAWRFLNNSCSEATTFPAKFLKFHRKIFVADLFLDKVTVCSHAKISQISSNLTIKSLLLTVNVLSGKTFLDIEQILHRKLSFALRISSVLKKSLAEKITFCAVRVPGKILRILHYFPMLLLLLFCSLVTISLTLILILDNCKS